MKNKYLFTIASFLLCVGIYVTALHFKESVSPCEQDRQRLLAYMVDSLKYPRQNIYIPPCDSLKVGLSYAGKMPFYITGGDTPMAFIDSSAVFGYGVGSGRYHVLRNDSILILGPSTLDSFTPIEVNKFDKAYDSMVKHITKCLLPIFGGMGQIKGSGASIPAKRWTTAVISAMGATESNIGISGRTLMEQIPQAEIKGASTDYMGLNESDDTCHYPHTYSRIDTAKPALIDLGDDGYPQYFDSSVKLKKYIYESPNKPLVGKEKRRISCSKQEAEEHMIRVDMPKPKQKLKPYTDGDIHNYEIGMETPKRSLLIFLDSTVSHSGISYGPSEKDTITWTLWDDTTTSILAIITQKGNKLIFFDSATMIKYMKLQTHAFDWIRADTLINN